MALLFYSGKLNFSGDYEVVKNPSKEFKPYSTFHYDIDLTKEPFVDFTGKNKMYLQFGAQAKLTYFGCVEIFFALDFSIDAKIIFSFAKRSLQLSLNKVKILNIKAMNSVGISRSFLNKLNYILDEVLNAHFKKTQTLDLTTVPLNELSLPEIADKLPTVQGDVLIYDNRSIMVGINFFNKVGDISKATNKLGNTDCYVAISETAATDVLKFWWNNKNSDIKIEFDENMSINFASAAAGKTSDIATRIITLGFIKTETDYDNMTMQCKGNVQVSSLPRLNFTEEGNLELLNLEFDANVNIKIDALKTQTVILDKSSIIPDSWTKFEDKKELSTTKDEPSTLLNTGKQFKINVKKAAAKLKFNSKKNDGSVCIKVTDADFKIEFDNKGVIFSDTTWAKLMGYVKEYVIDKIPEFTLSPSLILSNAKIFDKYTLSLENSKLTVDSDAIAIETDINVNEINAKEADVPNYVVDTNEKIVHDFSCEDVYKIKRCFRKGYFVMYEALAKDFKPCSKCLNGYTLIGK
ncbi:hypothetical protein [Fibrobacter sp. UWH5]|uniref:hypothetical protein n=1 Tax=Fibrobacter sp. UWH5 TaxID=1896211 RepID=UPI00093503F0|nr:hypothetical protein [Fibrobacter sp. UWH5]